MKRYPWESDVAHYVRKANWSLWMQQVMRRPLGWQSLSTPNTSPVAMPGYKQEKP